MTLTFVEPDSIFLSLLYVRIFLKIESQGLRAKKYVPFYYARLLHFPNFLRLETEKPNRDLLLVTRTDLT